MGFALNSDIRVRAGKGPEKVSGTNGTSIASNLQTDSYGLAIRPLAGAAA
jgi:hypothetical protein